ncbi:MAG: NF038122 family metalloprotease [Acidobacteria bacterium]|nr:NF038122 family metalloprotease [Acidobacteriota bacterium]
MNYKPYQRHLLSIFAMVITIISVVSYQSLVSSANNLGQKPKVSKIKNLKASEHSEMWVRYQAENGLLGCRDANETERGIFSFENQAFKADDLRQINHLELQDAKIQPNADDGLTIILRGTSQLDRFPEAKASFMKAAARWEAIIKSPITIIVDVDFGTTRFGTPYPSGVIGSTRSQELGSNSFYVALKEGLVDTASTDQERAFYNSLPNNALPTDLGDARAGEGTSAQLRALQLIDPVANPTAEMANFGPPPSIGFNSAFNYDFDPSDGITRNSTDFEGVAVHEIGHLLGFVSNVGLRELIPSIPPTPNVWDLFRFRPEVTSQNFGTSQRVLSSGGEQIFFTGTDKIRVSTGRPDGSGGDRAQASHWKSKENNGNVKIGVMDPFSRPGEKDDITAADMAAINIFGYIVGAVQPMVNVKVDAPNGRETIAAGGDLPIRWTVNSTQSLSVQRIELSTDGGQSFPIPVATGLAGNVRNFTFRLPSTILTNTARVRVTSTDSTGLMGSDASDADFAIAVPQGDFNLSIAPATQTVSAGSATSFTVNANALNGFTQQVGLSVSVSPQTSGVTASFASNIVAAGGNTTLTINTAPTAQTGTVTLNITGTAGSIVRSTTATVNVVAMPNFMLTANPATQSISAGSSGLFAVNLQALAGFNQPVTLTASSDQSVLSTFTFSQNTITAGQTVTLMIPTPENSPAVTANITITGTAGSLVRSTSVRLEIIAMDFALSFPSPQVTLTRGKTGQFVVKVDRINGFTGAVTVTPDAATLAALKIKLKSPASQSTSTGTVMFDVKLKKKSPVGTQKLVFVGQDGAGRVRQAELTLVIN